MNNVTWFFAVLILTSLTFGVFASPKGKETPAPVKAEKTEEGGHQHGEGEEEEEGGKVGPDKGITEANEKLGFKLSAEALKNFELKSMKLNGDGPWRIPRSAIVRTGDETNLYRQRDGFFKRIDFQAIKQDGNQVLVDSDQMRENDEIISVGIGFLRIAELAAFGGVAAGHSH